jgi:hypothetical protein
MIIDAQLLFSDAQALTGTSAVNSTNLIDLGADRNIGVGEPLAVVITVDVAAAGTTPTLTTVVQADDNAAFSSAGTVATTAALAAAQLTAGAKIVIPLPADTLTERFIRLQYTQGGTTPTVTVTAFLQPLSMVGVGENIYYADAITIG